MKDVEVYEYFTKIRNGDKEAFSRMFSKFKKPVFTVVCRIVVDTSLAEDITQDVFVKLYLSPPDSTVKNPRAWIFKVARNLSIDALRKGESLSIDEAELKAEDQCADIPQRLDIERAVMSLSVEERQIVTLHLNGGLKFSEIASVMGLSQSATYRRYKKALKSLKIFLEGGRV